MRGIMMTALMGLPFAVIGFAAGLIYSRGVYLPTFRWQRRQIARLQREKAQTYTIR